MVPAARTEGQSTMVDAQLVQHCRVAASEQVTVPDDRSAFAEIWSRPAEDLALVYPGHCERNRQNSTLSVAFGLVPEPRVSLLPR